MAFDWFKRYFFTNKAKQKGVATKDLPLITKQMLRNLDVMTAASRPGNPSPLKARQFEVDAWEQAEVFAEWFKHISGKTENEFAIDFTGEKTKGPKPNISFVAQKRLIDNMLIFCNKATDEKGARYFPLSSRPLWDFQLRAARKRIGGVCYGLSHMFLFSAFISDMQNEFGSSADKGPQDDLAWFYRCMMFLLMPLVELNPRQKQELSRFISLVIHFQNSLEIKTKTASIERNIFSDPATKSNHSQGQHVQNAEFTGERFIDFDEPRSEYIKDANCPVLKEILNTPGPLYISIGIVKTNFVDDSESMKTRSYKHRICMHKNRLGVYTFYDPNFGMRTLKLDENNIYAVKGTIFGKALGSSMSDEKILVSIGAPKLKPKKEMQLL